MSIVKVKLKKLVFIKVSDHLPKSFSYFQYKNDIHQLKFDLSTVKQHASRTSKLQYKANVALFTQQKILYISLCFYNPNIILSLLITNKPPNIISHENSNYSIRILIIFNEVNSPVLNRRPVTLHTG